MYRVVASVLLVLAILFAWYLSQEDSPSQPSHSSSDNDGIHINQ